MQHSAILKLRRPAQARQFRLPNRVLGGRLDDARPKIDLRRHEAGRSRDATPGTDHTSGGPFYCTGYYGGSLGLVVVVLLILILLGKL